MGKPDVRAEPLPEAEYPAWDQFVASAPTGSIYGRADYLDALCTAAGGRFRVLAARQGDVLLGGVGLYERDSRFGRFVSPRLLLYYNGPILRQHPTKYPSEQTARDLKALTALASALRGPELGSTILKPRSPLVDVRPFLAQGWTAHHGYTYVVSISDLEQARGRIEHNLRRLIDRCARAEMTVTQDDDFEAFFSIHKQTMERVGFQVYLPKAAFQQYYATLARQGLARLFHARLPDGRPVATQLVLLGHEVTHTVSAGAENEHLKSGATALLRWRVFEHLSGLGHTGNDLTDASLNAVTHFKSQLGGTLERWVELKSPQSARFAWGARMTQFISMSRSAAGAVVRRTLANGRAQPDEAAND